MKISYLLRIALLCRGGAAFAWSLPPKMSSARARFVTNTKCPYAQRTWIALEESGTSYKMTEISLYGPGGKPSWFVDLNPKGEVPVLVVDDSPIIGSEETVDFLMPSTSNSPSQQIASSRWRAIINDNLKAVGKEAALSRGSRAHEDRLFDVLRELDACLCQETDGTAGASSQGPFVCGDAFTAADASAFPFLQRIHGAFGFPAECNKLRTWYECSKERPGVKKTIKKEYWWWW